MSKITRRQFVGSAAVAVGAATLPAVSGVTSAAAAPALAMPITDFVPLDPKLTARLAWEIYKGGAAPAQAG